MMKIESGVPIPGGLSGGALSAKYPWADMEHGDSFLVEAAAYERDKVRRRVGVAGARWLNRNRSGWRCVTRTVEGGIRVWLVDPTQEPTS